MNPHELLSKKIKDALDLASKLSENEHDQYARCAEALIIASGSLVANPRTDRSAECKCPCHTGGAMHFKQCSCYDGNPRLEHSR